MPQAHSSRGVAFSSPLAQPSPAHRSRYFAASRQSQKPILKEREGRNRHGSRMPHANFLVRPVDGSALDRRVTERRSWESARTEHEQALHEHKQAVTRTSQFLQSKPHVGEHVAHAQAALARLRDKGSRTWQTSQSISPPRQIQQQLQAPISQSSSLSMSSDTVQASIDDTVSANGSGDSSAAVHTRIRHSRLRDSFSDPDKSPEGVYDNASASFEDESLVEAGRELEQAGDTDHVVFCSPARKGVQISVTRHHNSPATASSSFNGEQNSPINGKNADTGIVTSADMIMISPNSVEDSLDSSDHLAAKGSQLRLQEKTVMRVPEYESEPETEELEMHQNNRGSPTDSTDSLCGLQTRNFDRDKKVAHWPAESVALGNITESNQPDEEVVVDGSSPGGSFLLGASSLEVDRPACSAEDHEVECDTSSLQDYIQPLHSPRKRQCQSKNSSLSHQQGSARNSLDSPQRHLSQSTQFDASTAATACSSERSSQTLPEQQHHGVQASLPSTITTQTALFSIVSGQPPPSPMPSHPNKIKHAHSGYADAAAKRKQLQMRNKSQPRHSSSGRTNSSQGTFSSSSGSLVEHELRKGFHSVENAIHGLRKSWEATSSVAKPAADGLSDDSSIKQSSSCPQKPSRKPRKEGTSGSGAVVLPTPVHTPASSKRVVAEAISKDGTSVDVASFGDRLSVLLPEPHLTPGKARGSMHSSRQQADQADAESVQNSLDDDLNCSLSPEPAIRMHELQPEEIEHRVESPVVAVDALQDAVRNLRQAFSISRSDRDSALDDPLPLEEPAMYAVEPIALAAFEADAQNSHAVRVAVHFKDLSLGPACSSGCISQEGSIVQLPQSDVIFESTINCLHSAILTPIESLVNTPSAPYRLQDPRLWRAVCNHGLDNKVKLQRLQIAGLSVQLVAAYRIQQAVAALQRVATLKAEQSWQWRRASLASWLKDSHSKHTLPGPRKSQAISQFLANVQSSSHHIKARPAPRADCPSLSGAQSTSKAARRASLGKGHSKAQAPAEEQEFRSRLLQALVDKHRLRACLLGWRSLAAAKCETAVVSKHVRTASSRPLLLWGFSAFSTTRARTQRLHRRVTNRLVVHWSGFLQSILQQWQAEAAAKRHKASLRAVAYACSTRQARRATLQYWKMAPIQRKFRELTNVAAAANHALQTAYKSLLQWHMVCRLERRRRELLKQFAVGKAAAVNDCASYGTFLPETGLDEGGDPASADATDGAKWTLEGEMMARHRMAAANRSAALRPLAKELSNCRLHWRQLSKQATTACFRLGLGASLSRQNSGPQHSASMLTPLLSPSAVEGQSPELHRVSAGMSNLTGVPIISRSNQGINSVAKEFSLTGQHNSQVQDAGAFDAASLATLRAKWLYKRPQASVHHSVPSWGIADMLRMGLEVSSEDNATVAIAMAAGCARSAKRIFHCWTREAYEGAVGKHCAAYRLRRIGLRSLISWRKAVVIRRVAVVLYAARSLRAMKDSMLGWAKWTGTLRTMSKMHHRRRSLVSGRLCFNAWAASVRISHISVLMCLRRWLRKWSQVPQRIWNMSISRGARIERKLLCGRAWRNWANHVCRRRTVLHAALRAQRSYARHLVQTTFGSWLLEARREEHQRRRLHALADTCDRSVLRSSIRDWAGVTARGKLLRRVFNVAINAWKERLCNTAPRSNFALAGNAFDSWLHETAVRVKERRFHEAVASADVWLHSRIVGNSFRTWRRTASLERRLREHMLLSVRDTLLESLSSWRSVAQHAAKQSVIATKHRFRHICEVYFCRWHTITLDARCRSGPCSRKFFGAWASSAFSWRILVPREHQRRACLSLCLRQWRKNAAIAARFSQLQRSGFLRSLCASFTAWCIRTRWQIRKRSVRRSALYFNLKRINAQAFRIWQDWMQWQLDSHRKHGEAMLSNTRRLQKSAFSCFVGLVNQKVLEASSSITASQFLCEVIVSRPCKVYNPITRAQAFLALENTTPPDLPEVSFFPSLQHLKARRADTVKAWPSCRLAAVGFILSSFMREWHSASLGTAKRNRALHSLHFRRSVKVLRHVLSEWHRAALKSMKHVQPSSTNVQTQSSSVSAPAVVSAVAESTQTKRVRPAIPRWRPVHRPHVHKESTGVQTPDGSAPKMKSSTRQQQARVHPSRNLEGPVVVGRRLFSSYGLQGTGGQQALEFTGMRGVRPQRIEARPGYISSVTNDSTLFAAVQRKQAALAAGPNVL